MNNFFLKTFSIVLIFCCFLNEAQSQTPFNKESKIIHAGLGLGGYDFGLGYSSLPALSVSYDQGLIDDLGIGNLGIGGILGVKRYTYEAFSIKENYSRVFIGARGHYHFDFVNSEKLDFYAGVQAGAFFWVGDIDSSFNTVVTPGVFAGINYWLSSSFGVYAEAGYGLGFLNAGASLSF